MVTKRETSEEQLIQAGRFLMGQIIDVKTIGETLRWLLIERNVFSDAEYLAKYEEAAARLQKDLQAKLTEAHDTMALRLGLVHE